MDIHATRSVKPIVGGMASENRETPHLDFE
jgi:hypothetical protein